MKKLLSIIVLLLFSGYYSVIAQTDSHFSQYMFNEVVFNPASIEIANTVNASLATRQQWVGFENAPSTQSLVASTYIQNIYGGVGLNILNDNVGVENTFMTKAFYAFPVQITEISTVTLGLGAGILNRTLYGTKLNFTDENDPVAQSTKSKKENYFNPDFNFGAEYTDPNLTVGFAITHLTSKKLEDASIERPPMHYYLYGKYRFEEVAENIDIEPYLLFKSSWHITQFDINVIGYYNDILWAGFSYRLSDAISTMVGYEATDYMSVGYAYDYAIGTNRGYSGGSHEIMLRASFEGFNTSSVEPQTPRIFN